MVSRHRFCASFCDQAWTGRIRSGRGPGVQGRRSIRRCAWITSASTLAAGSENGIITLWNVEARRTPGLPLTNGIHVLPL
jgi:hypothetical protein